MRRHGAILGFFATAMVFSSVASARWPTKPIAPASSSASPEMDRLAKALAGDWNNVESMERSEFFPNGGTRRGISHVRLGAGGTVLIAEGQSDGSAGELSHLIVIWWDQAAAAHRLFTCFKDTGSSWCEVRGTAHWDGDTLVNDYEETVKGAKRKFRDSFARITPTSHALVESMDAGNGTMKTLCTTRSTRR